jgi:hypothetical protein
VADRRWYLIQIYKTLFGYKITQVYNNYLDRKESGEIDKILEICTAKIISVLIILSFQSVRQLK